MYSISPYSKQEIKSAFKTLDKSVFTKEKMKKVKSRIDRDNFTEDDVNRWIAEEKGISVETLISRPDYMTLWIEFWKKETKKFVNILKEELGISDIQAWAFICNFRGVL